MRYLRYWLITSVITLVACAPVDYASLTSWVYEPTTEYNPQGAQTYFPATTPINLKVIQTRKFAKPLIDVAEAIDISCKDRNAINKSLIKATARGNCIFPPEYKSKYTPKYSATDYLGKSTPLSLKYEYELIPSDDKKYTIVRIRAYFHSYGIKDSETSKQITNPKFYSEEFKTIADSLFVNAIEINPQEVK